MDVLFVSALYAPDEVGGAELSIRDFVNHAAARGWRAGVFATADVKAPDLIEIDGAPVFRAPIANLYHPGGRAAARPAPVRALWHAINLARGNPHFGEALKRFSPRLVCTNNLFGVGAQSWRESRQAGARVAHFLHDYSLLCLKGVMRKGDHNCETACALCARAAGVHRARSRAVELVLANSRATLAAHEGFFAPDTPQAVIGIGVDIAPFAAARAARQASDAPRFGYLGRLAPEKGVETLIAAFARARPSPAPLRIAGAGEAGYVAHVRALAERLAPGRIVFEGHVHPPAFLSALDVLVAPALWREPFGRVLIEGMAAGCVAVAPRLGGMGELIGEGDARGLSYAGPGDLEAALTRAASLAPAERDRMRAAGAAFAESFARARVADALYDRLEDLRA